MADAKDRKLNQVGWSLFLYLSESPGFQTDVDY